jgi:hypothetical protein
MYKGHLTASTFLTLDSKQNKTIDTYSTTLFTLNLVVHFSTLLPNSGRQQHSPTQLHHEAALPVLQKPAVLYPVPSYCASVPASVPAPLYCRQQQGEHQERQQHLKSKRRLQQQSRAATLEL